MPKRLVDGEALWRSKKMRDVPLEYRAEYANLIPLAEADGTFEADTRTVWSLVYSCNRENVTIEMVGKILDAFENAGMLVRKADDKGVVWGTFIGIESRLPSESTRSRYKQGNTNIFKHVDNIMIDSRPTHDKVMTGEDRFGLDLDSNGVGLEEETGHCSFKNISTHYASFMGIGHSHNKKHIEKYQLACARYGEDRVLELFDRWAVSATWLKDKRDANGLNLFWKPLEDMAAGDEMAQDRKVSNASPAYVIDISAPDPFDIAPDPDALSPEQILANRDKI